MNRQAQGGVQANGWQMRCMLCGHEFRYGVALVVAQALEHMAVAHGFLRLIDIEN